MRTSEQIQAHIQEILGFIPLFFEPAQSNPQVLENLWQQTLTAYINNPLSALFKEKLSAYLSRYCTVPYCMICHSCSLLPLGVKAQEVLMLLESPPPDDSKVDHHLQILSNNAELLTDLQNLDLHLEESLLHCSVFIALEHYQAEYHRTELRRLLGAESYQHLITFIAYVKTCHAWMEAHPEVAYEYAADHRAQTHLSTLVEDAPGLNYFFQNYVETVRQERQSQAERLAAIAERKRNEEVLRQSEKRFRLLTEAIPQQVWMAQADGQLSYVNQRVVEYFGRRPEQLLGWSWQSMVHPDDLDLCGDRWQQSLQTGQPFEVEFRLKRAVDEVYRWHLGRAIPLENDRGQIVSWVGTNTDIDDRKQAEVEMHKALDQEKELSDLKSRFVSMTSHEFRTPLSTILMSVGLLQDYGHRLTDEKRSSHYRRIQLSVHQMTQLLEDVLMIGKTEAGKLQFSPTPLALQEFCQDLVEEFQLTTNYQHPIILNCGNLPQDTCIDEKLLRVILGNLLSNAMKYSPQTAPVTLTVTAQAEEVTFQIQDQGIGIPLEEQQQLFESFFRARNVGTIQGTGLGLSIVKRCVDLHGGRITFASEPGKGTTFTVGLPWNRQTQVEQYAATLPEQG